MLLPNSNPNMQSKPCDIHLHLILPRTYESGIDITIYYCKTHDCYLTGKESVLGCWEGGFEETMGKYKKDKENNHDPA